MNKIFLWGMLFAVMGCSKSSNNVTPANTGNTNTFQVKANADKAFNVYVDEYPDTTAVVPTTLEYTKTNNTSAVSYSFTPIPRQIIEVSVTSDSAKTASIDIYYGGVRIGPDAGTIMYYSKGFLSRFSYKVPQK